ncbi:hypothetical protein [Flavobacterium psychrophilum]|uniref:hypothetical protein n=1 Tax=Flavobacterium psychrophilum TaxID=96345 RepID=UPI000B8E4F8C|nr:hypothetical protein [Flavobacterium psychrophilum]MCB6072347.1 hypothetical protein [Flavobacterium psychrophilum]MCB6109459.1 hypothetical protein [Flavobacterium psychrophilum]
MTPKITTAVIIKTINSDIPRVPFWSYSKYAVNSNPPIDGIINFFKFLFSLIIFISVINFVFFGKMAGNVSLLKAVWD